MAYQVRRAFETVVTGHASATGVAKQDAAKAARERLETAGDGTLVAVESEATGVYEFPAGPFDPYRIDVHVTVTVAVDAVDESAAITTGESTIDELLARADLDDVEFVSDTTLSSAAS